MYYSRSGMPPGRGGRVVTFEPRKRNDDLQADDALSIPSPDEPEEAAVLNNMRDAAVYGESSERPLFNLFGKGIWLDDIIILVLILLLISEGSHNSFIVAALALLFFAGTF